MSELMTLEEVSVATGVPIATLRFYRTTGRGPRTFVLAGRVRAKRADVEAWIEEQYQAEAKKGA